MSIYTLALFLLTSIGISLSPGPVMLFAFHNGVNYGMRTALFGILGSGLGCGLLISAIALSLDLLLRIFPDLLIYIQWFGMAYLCFLAYQLWNTPAFVLEKNRKNSGEREEAGKNNLKIKAFSRALLIAVSNPKGVLFFSVFFPQFISPDFSYPLQYLILIICFIPVDMTVASIYAFGGSYAARILDEKGISILNRCSASVLVVMALLMAFVRTGAAGG